MNVVDILVAIVVVTILVTIILAVVTYVAYKLRLSREPTRSEDDPDALRYFVPFDPPTGGSGTRTDLDQMDRDVADMGGHATEA